MLRRVSFVLFAVTMATALGCGHQVTPNPSTSNLSGYMLVRLRTASALDFNNFVYMIAIDTCGTGVPYPQAAFTGYTSYSYAFLIGAGLNTAIPELREYYVSSGNLSVLTVNDLSPSTTQFNPDDNGQGNEMDLIFLRADLNNPLNLAQPCPNATATPTSSPSGSPTSAPTQGISTWTINMISFNSQRIPQDSLGDGGATDTTFSGIVVDTTTTNVQSYNKPSGLVAPANPAAQLTYGEVDNYL